MNGGIEGGVRLNDGWRDKKKAKRRLGRWSEMRWRYEGDRKEIRRNRRRRKGDKRRMKKMPGEELKWREGR